MGKIKKSPPRWMLRFLRSICHEELLEMVEGDLYERYHERRKYKSHLLSSLGFFFDAIQFLRPFAFKTPMFYRSIYKSYLVTILRNLKRKKMFAAINILGMTLALSITMAIYAYVLHETSYDQYHEHADRTYRMTYRFKDSTGYDIHWSRMNQSWVNEVPEVFPQVEELVRFQSFRARNVLVGEDKYREFHAYAVDSNVFKVFDYQFIQGNADQALKQSHSVVLTSSTAIKYFGDASPIGQSLQIPDDENNKITYTVTAVIADVPSNSHMPVTLLTSINTPEERVGWAYTYIKLRASANVDALAAGMPQFILDRDEIDEGSELTVHFQPLKDIHLKSDLSREIATNGSLENVQAFIIIAAFLMLIASVNFANLNTILSFSRSKEIGLRKMMGAKNAQLKIYFYLEAFFLCTLSALLAGLLFAFGLTYIEDFIGVKLVFAIWQLTAFVLMAIVIISLISGFISGQMLILTDTVKALKGMLFSNLKVADLKRVLIGVQFVAALLLVSCTLIVRNQIGFMQNMSLGYEKEHVLAIVNNPYSVTEHYELFKEKLKKLSGVKDVTAIMELPSVAIKDVGSVNLKSNPELKVSSDIQVMDINGPDLLGMKLLAGNSLPDYVKLDTTSSEDPIEYLAGRKRAYLINEELLKQMGFEIPEQAIGEQMKWNIGEYALGFGPIVGVVQNFHQESLKQEIEPVTIVYEPVWLRHILVKVSTKDYFELHRQVESSWDELFIDEPMELTYLDEEFDKLYKSEEKQMQLISVFAGIALFISFIGLYAMIAFTLNTRLKELAIRRVLGSNLLEVLKLLGKEYLWLAIISSVIVVPTGWYIMNRWVENYAYHIEINGINFAAAALLLVLLLFLATLFHAFRQQSTNPATILRKE